MPTDRISRLLDDLRLHDQTRFELRVKRSHERSVHADWRFNPHPPLLAGETYAVDDQLAALLFQSTPAITGG